MEDLSLPVLFQKYLHYGEVIRNYRKMTLRAYRYSFKVFLDETHIDSILEVTRASLERFLFEGRTKRNWSSVTFRQYFKHLNCFFKWCINQGYLEENPLTGVEQPRLEKRIPRRLTLDEAKLVLDASFHMRYAYRFEKYRNRAIIGVMLFAGLRKQEVINLKLRDVNLQERMIFVDQGKGAKDRSVPIGARLSLILKEYLKDRKRLNRTSLQFFTGLNEKRPFGVQCIKKLFDRLRKRTKLDFSAHTLRHSFATLMLEGGCDIYTLSKMMGHAKITTTTIYLSCSHKQMTKSIEMHPLN